MGSEGQREIGLPSMGEASNAICYACASCFNPRNLVSVTSHLDELTSSTFSSLSCPNTNFNDHESLPSLTDSFSIFENAYPQYSKTKQVDEIRAKEFSHLALSSHVCLDYTGHGLFCATPALDSNAHNSYFDIVYKLVSLNSQLVGETNETGFQSKIRKRIFEFMSISEDDYSMVFTANKSSALKLLAETFPFKTSRNLLTVYDHESEAVETMTENAVRRGAIDHRAEFSWPNLRILTKKLRYLVENKKKHKKNKGLLVFPLQSSLTGARYPYLWMSLARDNGWNVLLDASALGAKDMETLGLSLFQPDFLLCSFYKVFGENPSGFGCLFIKKSSISVLDVSKNVGIVSLVPPQHSDFAAMSNFDHSDEITEIQESVEPNMALEELEFKGLDCADSSGLIVINNRSKCLVNWLVNALLSLKHPNSKNGLYLARVYGPKIHKDHGPALAFDVLDWKGEKIDPELVQKLADRFNISLSCGVLKHIQFPEKYREERGRLLEKVSKKGEISSGIHVLNASFGFLTNFEDVYRLWAFVSRFLDADFVEKEKWRYKALNKKTIEI